MSSTQLAEKPGSELAAASSVDGFMLACFRVVLVHWFTFGFGHVSTIQACSDLIVCITSQTSEVYTLSTLLQRWMWGFLPTSLGLVMAGCGHAWNFPNRLQSGHDFMGRLVNLIVLSCPVQKIGQQLTGGFLFLTPNIIPRVLVHDFVVCQPFMLPKCEFGS